MAAPLRIQFNHDRHIEFHGSPSLCNGNCRTLSVPLRKHAMRLAYAKRIACVKQHP